MRLWTLALARLVASSPRLLDTIGERWATRVLRALAASPRAADRQLALGQLDRLPEWLDLLLAWLDDPADDDLILRSLDGDSRLAGPYAEVALGTYLNGQASAALSTGSPADGLWALSLRVARWLRKRPSLGRLRFQWTNPRATLGAAPEALRDFARAIEAAGEVEPALARALVAWPGPPGLVEGEPGWAWRLRAGDSAPGQETAARLAGVAVAEEGREGTRRAA